MEGDRGSVPRVGLGGRLRGTHISQPVLQLLHHASIEEVSMFGSCPRSTPALELLAQPEQLQRRVAIREFLGAQTSRSEEASPGRDAAPGAAASSGAAQRNRTGAVERPLEVGVDVPLQRRLGAEPLPAAGNDAGKRSGTAMAEGHVTLQPLPGTRATLEHLASLPPTEVDPLVPGLGVDVSPADVVS